MDEMMETFEILFIKLDFEFFDPIWIIEKNGTTYTDKNQNTLISNFLPEHTNSSQKIFFMSFISFCMSSAIEYFESWGAEYFYSN